MTDKELDDLKDFMDSFADLEDFKKRFIILHPGKEEAFIRYFNQSRGTPEVWEMSKIFNSKETVRLDNIYRSNPDVTIDELLDELKKYDLTKYKRVLIKLSNANYDNIDKLSDIGLDINILVQGDNGYCTLKQFKAMRNFFNDFSNRYNTYNLSMLEKITLAYDYVKFFYANNETSDRLTDSRSIAKCISTGNIVCEGFSKMFCQLLSEMGINSNLIFIEPNSNEESGHVRVILRVDDDKYNVHDNFIFDPTWDSAKNTKLVCDKSGHEYFKSERYLKSDETVIRDIPSDCRYLYYMIPIEEFKKYFSNETIEKIVKYPSNKQIILSEDLKLIFNYNDKNQRDNTVLSYIEDLLRKTKKVEGYNDEQIELFISDAIGILNQLRFGIWDEYANKGDNR